MEVTKVGRSYGRSMTAKIFKSKELFGRSQMLEEFIGPRRGGVNPSQDEAGSYPILNDAIKLRAFLDDDKEIGLKSIG